MILIVDDKRENILSLKKILELHERLLQSEKDKVEYLEKLLKLK